MLSPNAVKVGEGDDALIKRCSGEQDINEESKWQSLGEMIALLKLSAV
ncbi:MAG: hypothetical protein ACJA0G_000318 [Kangiellaceae bacterium]|jgi:hypothetical protein